MKFVEIKAEEYIDFFKWVLEKDEIKITEEIDILLASSYDEPYIYYTEEIRAFFDTEPMRRIGQVNQLGTSINFNENAYHTRLEHCKGAYKNALDFWVLKCKDAEYREKIDKSTDKDHKKNLILADIMELARHDDCHTMLSHALEGLLCNGKVDHEEIGKRILLENEEYKKALNNIRPGLYEVMCDNAINDESAFKLLREGNTDFDRMDYIMRDLLYIGLPYSRDLIENMVRNCNIREITIDGEKQEVPVYTPEGFKYVEEFLKTRKVGYINEYSSQDRKVLDNAVKSLCKTIANNDEIESDFIRPAVINYMHENISDIDLNDFLKTNDIRFFTEVLDIAMNSENENLRELATLCLPSTIGLLQLGIEMLDTKQKGKDLTKYKEYELEYIQKLKELRTSENDVRDNIENKNKRKLYTAVNIESETELENIKNRIKQILKTENIDENGIIIWNKPIKVYKKNEPVYAEDGEGKIYTFDKHPDLNMDITKKDVIGIAVIPSIMRLHGYDDSIIESVKALISEKIKDDATLNNTKYEKIMSKFQAGKAPYLIGFEEK